MRRIIKALEYRLVVPGKPESFRSKKSKEFRYRIIVVANEIIQTQFKSKVEVYVDYFHNRKRKMDMDNISKNVMDSLIGIAYKDDRQVVNQNSTAHFLGDYVTISNLPLDSIKPLKEFKEYLFIRIREAS